MTRTINRKTMAKSFCKGCAHWRIIDDGHGLRFHACFAFNCYDINDRRELCNGRYWRPKAPEGTD